MKGAFRIPVYQSSGSGGGGGGSDPDPAVFCPANGYIIDPDLYEEPIMIVNTPDPTEGQIRLIATDQGSRHISFACSVSSSGKYTATVIGNNNNIINVITTNNNSATNILLPDSGEGFEGDGFTYYYIDIAPQLPSNNLLTFVLYVNTSYDPLGGYVIAAFIKAPGLTSLANAFKNNKRFVQLEFLCETNSLTYLNSICYGCSNFKKVVFYGGFPNLTSLEYAFYGAGITEINLPDDMPSLLSFRGTFSYSKLRNFTFPSNIPLVGSLYGMFAFSEIQSITFSQQALPEVNTLYEFCSQCYRLSGTVSYPEMNKVTTLEKVHYENTNVEEIIFQGTMPLVTSIKNLAVDCYRLKKAVLPESIEGITDFYNVTSVFNNCGELQEVVMPKTLYLPNNTSTEFFSSFIGCYKLHTISTIENVSPDNQYGKILGRYLLSLKRWDQPNVCNSTGDIFFEPNTGVKGSLEYFDTQWKNVAVIGLRNQKISISEVRRILSQLNPDNVHMGNYYPSYFYLSGNPEWDNIKGYWNPYGIISDGRTAWFTPDRWDSRIKIGSSLYTVQGNGASSSLLIMDNNYFDIGSSGYFKVAPYNGIRMIVYHSDYASFGLLPFKTFYVVNSDGNNGTTFQLSETLNGAPYQFGFGANEIGQTITYVYFSNWVVNIYQQGENMYAEMAFPNYYNSGSRYGAFIDTAYFDFWEMLEKKHRPETSS